MKNTSKKRLLTALFMVVVSLPLFAERVDMIQSGARTGGKILNTRVIKNVIQRLSAKGGGTLFFPEGVYLTGPIMLESNITLELEAGAELLFSDNFDFYLPFVEVRHDGLMMNGFSPLIYANGAENITIKGEGTLNGQGAAWRNEWQKLNVTTREEEVVKLNKYQTLWTESNASRDLYGLTDTLYHETLHKKFYAPSFIQLLNCKNVKIDGITIKESPNETLNPQCCQNIQINGVSIINISSPLIDGISPESCKDVHISNCYISKGNNSITLKSGRDAQGRELASPCENVTITNCIFREAINGITIGSEMSGDVKRVTVSNCVFDGLNRGFSIVSMRGRGGVVQDILLDNIMMRNIEQEAIYMDMGDYGETEEYSERTPFFRRIRFNNIVATEVQNACLIKGLPEMSINDVIFSNVHIVSENGMKIERAENVQFINVRMDAFSSNSFGLMNVEKVHFMNVNNSTPPDDFPFVIIENVKDCVIENCVSFVPYFSFIYVKGKYERIVLQNNVIQTANLLDTKSVNTVFTKKKKNINSNFIVR